MPSARQICRRLQRSWPVLLAGSLAPSGAAQRARSHARARPAVWISRDYCAVALRAAARRYGTGSVSYGTYDLWRERQLAVSRRRQRHASGLEIPTAGQIETLFGSWGAALTYTGLEAPAGALFADDPDELVERALVLCIETHGCLPTSKDLTVFARAHRLRLPRYEGWRRHVERTRERFGRDGRWFPPAPPPTSVRPDYTRVVPEALRDERPPDYAADREAVIAALVGFLDSLETGERASFHRFKAYATLNPGQPGSSTLASHGGYAQLVAEAKRRRRGGTGPVIDVG
ncbi:MAG TPA: hypothetical protein VNT32_11730 [Thermoleophilaceae bacterium]|nr:hypothetical protein [Thermoleophilaceae bacterium]